MRLNTLVPVLACLAAASYAAAADTAPSVKFDGFVVSKLGFDTAHSDTAGASNSSSQFTYDAKLGIVGTISDKVATQVDIQVNGNNGQALFRQAYGDWKITDLVDLKAGKFISDIGWISAYAPGLYRVNTGPIFSLYGQDQVGARVGVTKGEISGGLTVANGFFNPLETDNNGQTGQANESYACVADVVFNLPNKKGSVNGELVYDRNAVNATPGKSGGSGIHFGLNATLTPSDPITVGAEFIYQSISAVDGAPVSDSQKNMGLMAMVNYKLGAAVSFPASLTGMIQYVGANDYGLVDEFGIGATPTARRDAKVTELSVAMLTNPVGGDKLNLNFELSYAMSSVKPSTGPGADVKVNDLVGVAELIFQF